MTRPPMAISQALLSPAAVDNLLYFYTQPFEIVVDPFAGSGSTIDVCQKRLRRYWVSDRKPIPERAHEIRLWDMTEGFRRSQLA